MWGLICRWLVGLSYRVVYRRDPIPSHKVRRLNLLNDTLTHVHGEIYIDDEQLAPGKQPAHSVRDVEDHSFMRYAEVPLKQLCPCDSCTLQYLHIQYTLRDMFPLVQADMICRKCVYSILYAALALACSE